LSPRRAGPSTRGCGSWGWAASPSPARSSSTSKERSESFELNGKFYSAFTWSGPEKGGWVSEDFRLSINLGGVHLCPLAVGHIKKGALWPDDETLEQLASERPLGATAPTKPPGAAAPSLQQQQSNGEH
jgi:hypothetical protein